MNNTVFLILYGKIKILIFNYPLNKTNAPPRGGLCCFIAKAIPPLLKKGGPFLKEWVYGRAIKHNPHFGGLKRGGINP